MTTHELEAVDRADTLREAASLMTLLVHQLLVHDPDPLAPDVLARASYAAHELLEMAAA